MTIARAFTVAFFSLALVLVLAPRAHAVVPQPGTFVPVQCGQQELQAEAPVAIAQICIGQIVPEEGQENVAAVSFRMVDGSEKIYRVSSTASLLMAFNSGEVRSMFYLVADDGSRTTMNVVQDKANKVVSVHGSLSLLEGEASYSVSHFQPMFVIQGF